MWKNSGFRKTALVGSSVIVVLVYWYGSLLPGIRARKFERTGKEVKVLHETYKQQLKKEDHAP